MKNSRNENLSEHLLNVDEDILDKAYEIDDADKLRQYVKSKNAKARKPFYLTPMFRSAAAMVACFVFIIAAVFSFPDLLDPPGFDYVMLENGGNMADNVGGNGTTDVGGNGTTNVGGNGTTDVGGNGTTDVGGNGTTDVGGNGTTNVGGNGTTNVGGNGTTDVGGNGTTDVGGNGTTNVGGNGTTDVGGNGTTDVGGNGTTNVGGNGTTDVGGNGTTDVGGNGTTNVGGNGTTDVGGNGTTDVGGNGTTNVGGNGTTDVGGNDMVRTVLNGGGYAAPSLPHYVSTEVVKRCLISDNVVSANVYLGHPTFRNSVAFSDFVLDMDELQNCSFSIVINYNGGKSVTVVEAVDYVSTSYKVTSTDLYDEGEVYKGTVVNYSKYHKVDLDLSSMVGVPYGYVNIELHIQLPDGTQTLVMDDTLYYSVTDTEIVFGLVSNPIAHEGDDGIITHGWTYG